MRHLWQYKLRLSTLVGISILIFTGLLPQIASARGCNSGDGSVIAVGRQAYCGYFSNQYDDGSSPLGGFVLSGGLNVYNVTNLENKIKSYLASGGQDQTGAEFVIHTMIGDPAGTARSVGSTSCTASSTNAYCVWKQTVESYASGASGSITWTDSISAVCGSDGQVLNTFYQNGGANDDAPFYSDCAGETGEIIVFRDKTNTVRYALRQLCGNPIGRIGKLTTVGWQLSGTTTAVTTSVVAGQSAKFNNTVKNDIEGGTAHFAYGPRYFYTNAVPPARGTDGTYHGKSGGTGELTTVPNKPGTLGKGASLAFSYTTPAVDGSYKFICETAAFGPYDSDGDDNGRSVPVCLAIDNLPTYSLTCTWRDATQTQYKFVATWNDADSASGVTPKGYLLDSGTHTIGVQPGSDTNPNGGSGATWYVKTTDMSSKWPAILQVLDVIPNNSGGVPTLSSAADATRTQRKSYSSSLCPAVSGAPSGTLSLNCTAGGVGWAAVKFGDPNGATTAQLRVTFVTGSTPTTQTYNIPTSYSSYSASLPGPTTWNSFVIPTPGPPPGSVPGPNGSATTPANPATPASSVYFNGNWSAQLVIQNVGPGSPATVSDTANCTPTFATNCSQGGFLGTGTLTPGLPYSFTVSTKILFPMSLPAGFSFTVNVVSLTGGVSNPSLTGPVGPPTTTGTPPATVTSGQYTFTPQAAHYEVQWTATAETSASAPCKHPLTAGYQPFFSVQGGDVAAGTGYADKALGCGGNNNAGIAGSNTNTSPFAGANARLGAIATGDITGFPSGLALAGGSPALNGYGLSFANAGAGVGIGPGQYGGSFGGASAGTLPCQKDYYGSMPTSAAPLGGAVTSFASMSGSYQATAPAGTSFYLGAAADATASPTNTMTLGAGQQVTIYISGDVFITDNVQYVTPYASLADIPRFNLYVKGNIYISPHVHYLEGVYVAQQDDTGNPDHDTTGIVNTCGDGDAKTTWSRADYYTDCKLNNAGDAFSLKVTGVLSAENNLSLTRTYGNPVTGAGLPPLQPAELFEYNPELWLTKGTARIDSYTALPPVL